MRVLLVGFGPFPGAPFNPSAVLAKALVRRRRPAFADTERSLHIFATSYTAVDRDLPALFAARPDIILIFGLAKRRRELCIETRARNAASVLFPDVKGHRPERTVISRGRSSTLGGGAPFAALLGAVRGISFPARLSRDAGRYLCNYAYWQALEHANNGPPLVQFVHIPPVRFGSRKVRRGRPLRSFSRLVTAAEALLIALIAASRR